MKKNFAVLLAVLAAACASDGYRLVDTTGSFFRPATEYANAPRMEPKRKVSAEDCSRPIGAPDGNLLCKGPPSAAELRRREEEERQRKLAAERRARMEEEERLAKARKEAAERAERERLAAEQKAREERERQERAAAEARARQIAEQEAREAAERERRRLLAEWLAGRALLKTFVAKYGKYDYFNEPTEDITGFLDSTSDEGP